MNPGVLITGCDAYQQPIADLSTPGLRWWCKQNDWLFQFEPCPADFYRHPHFWKWQVAIKYAKAAALVMWLDADIVLYNPLRKLEMPAGCKLAFSGEKSGGLCAGGWLAHGGDWLKGFAETLLFIGPPNDSPRGQDQAAANHLRDWPGLRDSIGLLPLTTISNPDFGRELPALLPLFHHLWANRSLDTVVREAEQLAYKLPKEG